MLECTKKKQMKTTDRKSLMHQRRIGEKGPKFELGTQLPSQIPMETT
jgi:hypothetical protein